MTTCEICGRSNGIGWGWCSRSIEGSTTLDSMYCYEAAWKAEKARADAMEVDREREKSRGDALHAAIGKVRVKLEDDDCDTDDILRAVNGMLRVAGYEEPAV